VIWQRAADTSDRLEPGHALCVAHSNEKVADRHRERRFRDTPNEQHTHVAQDRVRLLQERSRELADGGVNVDLLKLARAGEHGFRSGPMRTTHSTSNSFTSASPQQYAQKFRLIEL
jgi:hypothetical protein